MGTVTAAVKAILRAQSTTGDTAWYARATRFLECYFTLSPEKQRFLGQTVEPSDGTTPTGWFNPGTRKKGLNVLELPRDYFTGGVRDALSEEDLSELLAFRQLGPEQALAAIDGYLDGMSAPATRNRTDLLTENT